MWAPPTCTSVSSRELHASPHAYMSSPVTTEHLLSLLSTLISCSYHVSMRAGFLVALSHMHTMCFDHIDPLSSLVPIPLLPTPSSSQ